MSEEQQTGWVIIPPQIVADENLTNSQKMLLGRIMGLSNKKGYCYASNEWLGQQLGLKPTTISGYISELVEDGYIKRVLKKTDNEEVKERRLYPLWNTPPQNKQTPPQNKPDTPPQNKPEVSVRDNSDRERGDVYNDEKLEITQKENGLYDYPEDFEKVWSKYPFQRGTKKATWKKWKNKRKNGVDNNLLVQSAKNYDKKVKYEEREEKYVKRAETFFGPNDHWQEFIDDNFELNSSSKNKDYVETLN